MPTTSQARLVKSATICFTSAASSTCQLTPHRACIDTHATARAQQPTTQEARWALTRRTTHIVRYIRLASKRHPFTLPCTLA
jgi:hypothetical protein